MNESDLMALIAGCRTAQKRVIELCDRFGKDSIWPLAMRCWNGPATPCAT